MFSMQALRSLNRATFRRAVSFLFSRFQPFVIDQQADELCFAEVLVINTPESFLEPPPIKTLYIT